MYFTTFLNDIQRMQNQMARTRLSGISGEEEFPHAEFPAIQIYSNAEELAVRAEVPGLSQDEIGLSITDDVLTISGDVKKTNQSDEMRILHEERSSGKFQKIIELPYPVEGNKSQATLKNGILTVIFPIKEAVKPRQIQIKGE